MAKVSLGRSCNDAAQKPAAPIKNSAVPEVSAAARAEIAGEAEVQTAKKKELPSPWVGLDDNKPKKGFPLRMTEKVDSQVKFIAEHTEFSANSFILAAIREHLKKIMPAARRRQAEKAEDF